MPLPNPHQAHKFRTKKKKKKAFHFRKKSASFSRMSNVTRKKSYEIGSSLTIQLELRPQHFVFVYWLVSTINVLKTWT